MTLNAFRRFIFLYSIIIIQTEVCESQNMTLDVPGWFWWHNQIISSNYLVCSNICKSLQHIRKHGFGLPSQERCCRDAAQPIWYFHRHILTRLYVEILSVDGSVSVVISRGIQGDATFTDISHSNGFLIYFPYNICIFNKTVSIDFSYNKIHFIPDIKCMYQIDKLNLSNNRIETIPNTTFSKLSSLRDLDLSRNRVMFIEPNSFSYSPSSLLLIRVRNNLLSTVDITNVILERMFSSLDYSHNTIDKFTNTINWKCCRENTHGGLVDLSYNTFRHFPNLTEIGFESEISMGKLVRTFSANLHECNWICDCRFVRWMQKSFQFYDFYPAVHELYNISCSNPPHLRHMNLPDFRFKNGYDLMICNISLAQKCPRYCYCFEQPSQNRTVIDCSSKGLLRLPVNMPDNKNLDINISNNTISIIHMMDYFQRTFRIDLSDNMITNIAIDFMKLLHLNYINLLGNPIKNIHTSMHRLDPCRTFLGKIKVECDCNSMWIKPWLSKQESLGCTNNNIICQTKTDEYNASSITRDDLCTAEYIIYQWKYVTPMIASTIALLFVSWILYLFRIEFSVLTMTRLRRSFSNGNGSQNSYDVFVSINDENSEFRSWVLKNFVLYLEQKSYNVFLPCRDLSFGGLMEDEIARTVALTTNVLIILSEDYLQSRVTNIEWKYCWNSFKSGGCNNILIVNFDFLETENLCDRRMKALLRLGHGIDFTNGNKSLYKKIETLLGAPKVLLNRRGNNDRPLRIRIIT